MGLFNWLFGKKSEPAPPGWPPEFARAVELQRANWKYDAEEEARLLAQGPTLPWREALRLHHLLCLRRIAGSGEQANARCLESVERLASGAGRCRPVPAFVWQGEPMQGRQRDPDMRGDLLNPSITHFGCLEFFRCDAAGMPTSLEFVPFDDLAGIVFGRPSLLRFARLVYAPGRLEVALVPLLYGTTWEHGNEYDRDGRMTRFIAHLPFDGERLHGATGISVGQQDLAMRGPEGGEMFGLGSVAEIAFPLDMRDPRFDEKARARGIDPDEIRRRMGGA